MEINELRGRIDEINNEILALFKERMEVSKGIAQYKKENGLPIYDATRERDILYRMTGEAGPELAQATKTLFHTLFALSRAHQGLGAEPDPEFGEMIAKAIKDSPARLPERAVVACQGVEGAHSQAAADRLFPMGQIVYFQNFEGVFQAVDKGLCEYGVLPIENSLHGSVNEVYDLMKKYSFSIVRKLKFPIRQTLLAKPGVKLSEIREVVSHEQAIGQCSNFLKDHPEIKVTYCANTAVAAQMVSKTDRRDLAAISSAHCAELYGLSVLDRNIQNTTNNYTRFICISKNLQICHGANCISIMTTTAHTPGALRDLLSMFAVRGLNLTKLESRPIPGKDFEVMFYFDFEGNVDDEEVIKLLAEMKSASSDFAFLGSYSEVV